jgi:uncharacterized membrane protein YheB (UPF0754 family)
MKESFKPMHADIKNNIHSILDIEQMSIDALVAKPKMMVDMFREVGAREFRFIQHVAAVMGFILGLVQTVLYVLNNKFWQVSWFDYVLLPVSGLIIGYFTNWLAIFLTFRPIEPKMCCCGYGQVQGVFLKRQTEASHHLAKLVCSQIVDAKAMLEYILKSGTGGVDKVLEIYQRHIERSIDQTVGLAKNVIPAFVGQGIDDVKNDVIDMSLEILPKHSERIEKFIDEQMCVEQTLSTRLARVPPAEFEDIMHPIFKDDEWILLVVGGILGVIIGLLQAFFMNLG